MASVPNDDASSSAPAVRFADLRLAAPVLEALTRIGYESPSPIQARTIPPLLEGRDVLGQAQTGTGKTAAFALPILSMIDASRSVTQALVLAPTRELAIQVAEALQNYASNLPGFHVLPIYGGQSYEPQLRGLKRGAHVVVGTPGRVVDHIKRGSLKLDNLRHLVLDEADEMLRMGFIDDVEWVLQQTPPDRQIALFSATMPSVIRRVAQTYLRDPIEIAIKSKTSTATNIRQRYWLVSGMNKIEALTRFFEAETFDAMIVFARTKAATTELADRLLARGFSPPARSTATCSRTIASARSASSKTARSTSSSPPTSPRAVSTWSASAMSSTTTFRPTPKATCIASAAPAAPAAAATRSCSSARASAIC
jgi:ATP-dependent RNA helicase DeaD